MTVTVPESFADLLAKPTVAIVTTIGPRGEPHAAPVWFEWDGQTLAFESIAQRQKVRNLERDDRVSAVVVDPDDTQRYLEIRGTTTFEPDPGDEFINRMAKRYLGVDEFPYKKPGDVRHVVRIHPTKVNSMG